MAPKGKSPFFEPPSLPAYVHTQYKDGPLGGKYSTKHKMHHTCFAHTCNKLSHVCLQKGKFKRVLNNFLLIFLAQPIQPNLSGNGPDWLCCLAGNFQTAPTIFFIFSAYVLLTIS